MFCHEKLHGVVWGETRNRQLAAALVHEWEKQGILKEKVKADVELYYSREKAVESLKNKLDSMKYQRLQIFRPMISKRISQHFGENLACIDSKGKIYGIASGKKCPVSFYKSIGVDVVSNEPLFFPFPIPTELINTAVPYTQYGVAGFTHHVKMRYWHLYAPVGFNKKQVTCGTVVGQAGNTGASSGPHLHFAPKWCLPTGEGVASNNGYTGAFDPTPYYNHEVTAKDHALYMKQPVVPLSAVEQKDMIESLSVARGLLLALQKLVHTI
jgi:hypothetical protein